MRGGWLLLCVLATAVACGASAEPPPHQQVVSAPALPGPAPAAHAAPAPVDPNAAPAGSATSPQSEPERREPAPADPSHRERLKRRAAALAGRSPTQLGCDAIQTAYRESFTLAAACAADTDCTALEHTSLICPGCQAFVNPAAAAYADVRALAAAFRTKRCSLAPCTPPLCQHLSVTCQRSVCVTVQR